MKTLLSFSAVTGLAFHLFSIPKRWLRPKHTTSKLSFNLRGEHFFSKTSISPPRSIILKTIFPETVGFKSLVQLPNTLRRLYLRLSKQNLKTLDNNNQLTLRLFPNYFKRVGLVCILLTAAVFVYLIWAQPNATQQSKDLVKSTLQSVFLAGILLIAIARDRIEDEAKQYIRIKAMATAFVFGMVYAIIDPFIDPLFRTTENHDARELAGTMLIFYLVLFYILKQRRR